VPPGAFYATAETVTAHALAALDAARAPKQFFWFHYFDAHAPYGASVGEDVTSVSVFRALARDPGRKGALLAEVHNLYRADLASLDRSLDTLLARLDADRERFTTHVLIASDHGESLGEGDSLGHGMRLDEAEIRVPALLLSPAVAAGLREETVGSVDVAPTLLRLAGLPVPPGVAGRELASAAAEPRAAFGMRRTFASSPAYERRLDGRDHLLPELEFYAVRGAGPYVVGNAARLDDDALEGAAAAQEQFRGFEHELSAQRSVPVDEETARALEALGYAP
jgi:arylsulfatase A-like enzyme